MELPQMTHQDGIPWHDAKVPFRFHRCKPQTTARFRFETVDRCACGATRFDGGPWINKNETRNNRTEMRKAE